MPSTVYFRQDNADLRLRKSAGEVGLVDDETYAKSSRKRMLDSGRNPACGEYNVGMTEAVQSLLESKGSTPLKSGISLAELISQTGAFHVEVALLIRTALNLLWDVQEQVNINIKYDGYIRRQMKQVEQFKKLKPRKIAEDLDYEKAACVLRHAETGTLQTCFIGQASGISGVSPADI